MINLVAEAAFKSLKMGATQVETQTQIEERLFPSFLDTISWVSAGEEQNGKHWEPLFHRSRFLRSSSLSRIKQFPAYLCNQSSSDVLILLYAVKATLSHTFKAANKQFQSLIFMLAVYCSLFLLAAQFCACIVMLSSIECPPGLIFMLGNVGVLCIIGLNVLPHHPKTKKRKQM